VNASHNGHEHELEPQHGLPERLPAGERILWQGSPDPTVLARSAFHLTTLGVYFALLLALAAGTSWSEGASLPQVLSSITWPAALAAVALLSVGSLAWLSARTTVYTITDRRVVMRIGIVLTLTFNLPLRRLATAGLRLRDRGHGDIVLELAGSDRIAWVHLWPHARPWRLGRPQPMLRAVPDGERVARLLTKAWAEANQAAANPVSAPDDTAAVEPVRQRWQPSPT